MIWFLDQGRCSLEYVAALSSSPAIKGFATLLMGETTVRKVGGLEKL